ncbi:ATPase family associated with various cellular activities (AAA) [Nitrosospira briensis]|uniref:ATPase family associated with various cellular activities (AAA) n=1 Tax=Nitrosospira briensis TaxID=35799 RepID=A0A1I5E0Q3_9PROT|nr:ATP-binding protein [Nitrosospira briensis]SFO05042.1 ATPase family associated with various cellular activities (AAA) [Nitrosospira briensis]
MANVTTPDDLEDYIPMLRKLDVARQRSAQLRDTGIEFLMEHLQPAEESDQPPVFGTWRHEYSLVVRALLTRHDQPFSKQEDEEKRLKLIKSVIDQLQKDEKGTLTLEKLAEHELSVLVAASVLRALVAQPGVAFSKTAMLCYYWIIRELYSADRTDWNIGGARAAPGSLVTAFTTGECVRALLSFADALRNTGNLIAEAGDYMERTTQLDELNNKYFNDHTPEALKEWVKAEKEQLCLAYFIKSRQLCRYLVLTLCPDRSKETLSTEEYRQQFKQELNDQLKETTENFAQVLHDIVAYRKKEYGNEISPTSKDALEICKNTLSICEERLYGSAESSSPSSISLKRKADVTRSASAHLIAFQAVQDARKRALEKFHSVEQCTAPEVKAFANACKDIKQGFDESARQVEKLLIPSRIYLSSILDRELALASLGESWDWQPSELACAAASYGKLTKAWGKDARFDRAVSDISKMISNRGQLANLRHFHQGPDGPRQMMSNAAALHAIAQLLHHACDSKIDTSLIDNMLRFFEDTSAKKGWDWEYSQPPLQANLKATARAIMALAKINEMLDKRINHIILKHFSVKEKNIGLSENLTLDSLFYPDYGLRLAPDADTLKTMIPQRPPCIEEKDWPKNGIQRLDSIAITLQRMCAHVSGVSLPKREPLCSLVLHGPAGTGKTTLVEALAVSCDVKLVEVTPSDLVKYGEQDIEQRARAVFEALSMLTRTVILFDEFDPVLKRRKVDPEKQLDVFSFLTPGMLPKLKNLHNWTEKRSVAYVLVTNLIGTLDEAAVRKGRFDERLGIYPPDLLSRTGRFLDQIYPDFQKRLPWVGIIEIIKKTEGKGMTTLGKPGWFTIPDSEKKREELKKKPGTPFHFLHLKQENPDATIGELRAKAILEWPEPDDELKGILGEGPSAVREWLEWTWINLWDELLSENANDENLRDLLNDRDSLNKLLKHKFAQRLSLSD